MLESALTLAAAFVGIGLAIWGLRVAARKNRAGALQLPEMDTTPPRRRRREPAPDVAVAESPPASSTSPAEPGVADAFGRGLARTRGGFVAKLTSLFGKKQFDATVLEELEHVLFTADLGPRAAERIFSDVKKQMSRDALSDANAVWRQIRETSAAILAVDAPPVSAARPLVVLMIGVNGVGKTTTIGKLATRFRGEGKRVMLGAGDTFRAAATEQLEEWARRADVPIVKGASGQDPSSVIFEAIRRGVEEDVDVILCDTAGRLHSNAGLMDELKKIRRVCEKALPGSPHETWMVLDATTGQNAIAQAKTFKSELAMSGIVMTKLDGTAKGGVILGICDELGVPVRYVGVGESADDLRPFDAGAFLDALYPREAG